jgi:hypothetical protein
MNIFVNTVDYYFADRLRVNHAMRADPKSIAKETRIHGKSNKAQ